MALDRSRADLRIFVLATAMLLGLGALGAKLWWVQIVQGGYYTAKILGSSKVTVRVPSVRGEIRDRNGISLVSNRASFDVDFYLPEMVSEYRKRSGGDAPMVSYQQTIHNMRKDKREEDIIEIVNTAVVKNLVSLDLAKDYSGKTLRRHYRTNRLVPFTYLQDIDFKTIAKFSEHNVGLPGVDINIRPVRQYVYGAFAAHILGYVGMPHEISELEDVKEYDYYQPNVDGKTNIEKAMDKYLRGKPGVRVMQRNVKGQIDKEIRLDPPQPGHNVYLTIDARIQMIVEKAIRSVGRGAAVVMNPNNGDILAMASVPSYDPNVFIPSISTTDWQVIDGDETDPLTNRAVSPYAPGSTYKLVTSLGGLRKGMGPNSRFTCSGGVPYGNKYMKCWVLEKHMAPHGSLDLANAIKHSCNAFFYQYGNAAGIDNIDAVGEALGLGQRTGVELSDEKPGVLPGPIWLQTFNPKERWSNGHTANVSIGQGYVLATPLQMCTVAATVANRGVTYQPRLIDRVLDPAGNVVTDENGVSVIPGPRIRMNMADAGVTQEQVELVRRGMWKVVNEAGGTAKKAAIKGYEVAGKTGTAQFWRGNKKDNHTWFVCFAPYDAPKFAVCVFVQGAKAGGAVPAPIAAKILSESLALDHGYQVELARLDSAPGSFKFIDQVSFDSDVPTKYAPSEEETADHMDAPDKKLAESQGGRDAAARPDIQAEADDQGRVSKRSRGSADGPERRREKKGIFENFFGTKDKPKKQSDSRSDERKRPRWPF